MSVEQNSHKMYTFIVVRVYEQFFPLVTYAYAFEANQDFFFEKQQNGSSWL